MIRPETADAAVQLVKKGAAEYEYFFANLRSADWLLPLLERGFFRHPPPARRDGDTISFVFWPESKYLARVAAEPQAQGDVLRIALQIPDTDNVYVHEDLVDVALGLPASISRSLAPRLGDAVARHHYRTLLPRKVGELISHLSRGGQGSAALDLARRAMVVVADPRRADGSLPPEPGVAMDAWSFGEILRKNGPDLIAATGLDGLRFLSELLSQAMKLSSRSEEDQPPEDYSEIWRPTLESDHFPERVKEMLVTAVRDAAAQVFQSDPSVLAAELAILERQGWRVFERLALHLLRVVGEAPLGLVIARVENNDLFRAFPREYALLLEASAQRLPIETVQKLLEWVELGPDVERFKSARERWAGEKPSDEETESWIGHWQQKRLAPLKTVLPKTWRHRFEVLVEELGAPAIPGSVETSSVWVGPSSPKTAEDLATMPDQDLIEYLRSFKWDQSFGEPSPEGLGRVLSTVVARDPERFAAVIEQFEDLDPTYVRAVIQGLHDAAREKRSFRWAPGLPVLLRIVLRPVEIPGRTGGRGDQDPSWAWARSAVAQLLERGLEPGAAAIPCALREPVWKVLRPLTDDPEPTPEYEAKYGGTNMDPLTLSINTTRGKALHAAVRYGLWVRQCLVPAEAGEGRIFRGLVEMPELFEILDAHLARDPSLAVRAVYGNWFPWLTTLDPEWAASRIDAVFPATPDAEPFFRAAWEAYVVYSRPFDSVFALLRPVYLRAVEQIGPDSKSKARNDPESHLAEHLMLFYGRGRVLFGDKDRLLETFFERAGGALRAYAIQFVGRSLVDVTDVPAEVIGRFRTLWGSRLQTARESARPHDFREELAAFGWWFDCDVFNRDWALEQLLEVVRLGGGVDPDFRVAERLRETAEKRPFESVQCLVGLIEADNNGWGFPAWKDDAEAILATALKSGDRRATEAATDLVHRLGAKGHWEFRKLLPRVQGTKG